MEPIITGCRFTAAMKFQARPSIKRGRFWPQLWGAMSRTHLMGSNPTWWILAFCIVFLGPLGGCASLPGPTPERALYVDTRNIIESGERLDWVVDARAIDDALPEILKSACQVEPAARQHTLDFIDAQRTIESQKLGGGSAETIYQRGNHDLGDLSHLLTLERSHRLLAEAIAAAPSQCPFWLEADPDFTGIHGVEGFSLILESNGGGGLIVRGKDVALGGGGAGRVLPAYGFSTTMQLATGLEIGAIAAFPENDEGNRELEAQLTAHVPVLLRMYDGLTIYDFEAAPAFRYLDSTIQSPGFRVSAGIGLATLRGGNFMPHAVLWIGYEYQPARLSFDAEHSIRFGTRVGLNWLP